MDRLQVRAGRDRSSRCPYCRESIADAVPACEGCGARVHLECRAELRRCPTLGCGSASPAPVAGDVRREDRLVLLPPDEPVDEDATTPPALLTPPTLSSASPEEESLLARPRPVILDWRQALELLGWSLGLVAPLLLGIAVVLLSDWRLRRAPWSAFPAIALATLVLSPIALVSLVRLAPVWALFSATRRALKRGRPEVMVAQRGRGVALWRSPIGPKDGPALWFPWSAASGDRTLLAQGDQRVRVWRSEGVVVMDDGAGRVAVARLE